MEDLNKETSQNIEKKEISKKIQKNRKKKRFLHSFIKETIEWCFYIIICLLFAVLINSVLIINANVPTGSMENTIPTKSRLFGNRLSYINKNPERGDIVIFWAPEEDNILYVKRVIGMPNDIVEIKDGVLYINGEVYEEDYVKNMSGTWEPFEVPEGKYFVLGDNRNNSHDARYWKDPYISKDDIIAKAVIMYWPKIQILK